MPAYIRLLAFFACLLPTLGQAALAVVASSSSTGMLVREIAGTHAELAILAPPDRDLHHLQARPGMLRALRAADLVVAIGADLEVGWLPVAIAQAANPRILPGRPGYFEAASAVALLDADGAADRALGDAHPAGNPHLNMDPVRMAQVGLALAERLAELDPAHAADYRRRAAAFQSKVDQQLTGWRTRMAAVPGVLSFHRDLRYLLDRFAVPQLGTLEPVPGVPPSGAHLKQLIDRLKGTEGVVAFTPYQPAQAPQAVAAALGWRAVSLALEPPLDADGDAYLAHLERWIQALAGGA